MTLLTLYALIGATLSLHEAQGWRPSFSLACLWPMAVVVMVLGELKLEEV